MTDPLDTLRPEVREAFLYLDRFENCPSGWTTIRAELLRLADYEQAAGRLAIEKAEFRHRAEKAEAEIAESRETIKRLNRRVQVAEAAIAEKVKASAPGSLGRALANAAASKAEAELAALKARIAEAKRVRLGTYPAHGSGYVQIIAEPREGDQTFRLLVDEPPAERGGGDDDGNR